MSLDSTPNLKAQLTSHLGDRSRSYFELFSAYVSAKISRTEFEEEVRKILDTPYLIQLHNSLVISLFDAIAYKQRPPSPSRDAPKPPPRKRRRVLPYQGPDTPDEDLTYRSARLKKWALGIGQQERARLRELPSLPPALDPPRPRPDTDEIARERGVIRLLERGDPPGSRLPVNLASMSRAPTVQHIADRVNLICAQNNIGPPSRQVPLLINLACEVKLKQLIARALSLTSSSHAISSINASKPSTRVSRPAYRATSLLTRESFRALFVVAPYTLPNQSAAATELFVGDATEKYDEDTNIPLLRDREVNDPRWQTVALLAERSTVREALASAQ
ncbi:transcriptional regulator of RNA polII, SAGA, subunit-domain-containing protein [Schizophyllum commune]